MSATAYLGWPNRVSIARALLVAPFVVCLLNVNAPGQEWIRWTAVALFAVMAASDGLDGYLARRLNQRSALGAFLDPLADKLLVTAAVIILCVEGVRAETSAGIGPVLKLPNWVAVTAIGKDLVVSIGFGALRLVTGQVHIVPRTLGKWCTTVQLFMVLSILLSPNLHGMLAKAPAVLWTAASVLAVVAALDYIRTGGRIASSASHTPPAGDAAG